MHAPSPQAVWLSASADLAQDAERDLRDIGALQYAGIKIHDMRHQKSCRKLSELPGVPPGGPAGGSKKQGRGGEVLGKGRI